ncbi:M1 family metallopeptidase (plasmid) [Pseudoalteromonas sp. CF6-2]|uniref:M1 family metallopeptidase n=1 Tax=Pseudoalteromonas sp. CF6-2 TaxID=562716 RepID=UPI001F37873F|nr:M1 family metallopeptidase [Pseudoalteromonas sp. CF6-2]
MQVNQFVKVATTFVASAVLAACSSKPIALDPVIGDTGQALSAIALKSDVKHYDLALEVFPDNKRIKGIATTDFKLLAATQFVELKLDSRFTINEVSSKGEALKYERDGGVIRVDLGEQQEKDSVVSVAVAYQGFPHIAKNAPWDGGFVFSKTEQGEPWIATAVQGEGCDLFWPCKDHFADKADSMRIRLTVPQGLSAVTNGVLQEVKPVGGNKQQFDWLLSVPASDYNIALNIGPYTRIQTDYTSVNGATVPIEFWSLKKNEQKARELIENDLRQQVTFFEKMLGPYPWGGEKLGFVETPHLGMEHQTVNAYGKKYKRDPNGYDWLLQHELAHEWFGNLMTHEKLNDAWLHEGFGFYMQPSYSLYKFGDAAYKHSMYSAYLGLKNCEPVVLDGQITSDQAFNSDIYGKGGWTLHTLRWLVGEDVFWQATRELLYGVNNTASLTYPIAPRYRNTNEFIAIINRLTKKDYQWFFNMYLKQAELPELTETYNGDTLTLSWQHPQIAAERFPMPVPISTNGIEKIYQMDKGELRITLKEADHVVIDPNMKVLRYLPIIDKCKNDD